MVPDHCLVIINEIINLSLLFVFIESLIISTITNTSIYTGFRMVQDRCLVIINEVINSSLLFVKVIKMCLPIFFLYFQAPYYLVYFFSLFETKIDGIWIVPIKSTFSS